MFRNMATLLAGNAAAQVVNVLTVLFVVVAFFAPAEFGRYAVVMSYVGILSSIACFRYELSIVSAKTQRAANNAVGLSIGIAVLFSLVTLLAFELASLLFGDDFLLGSSALAVVTLVFLKAVGQVFASVLYRQEAYMRYSLLKFVQSLALLAGFLTAGVLEWGLWGLLTATAISYLVFAVASGFAIRVYSVTSGLTTNRIVAVARRQADFVKFNMPQALIDNLLANGLNLVLALLSGPVVVGYFSLMQKLLKAPLSLVFGAMSQVIYRFSAIHSRNSELMLRKLGQAFVVVVFMILIAAIAIFVVFTYFPRLTFFSNWAGLQEYMLAFAIWMLAPFLFSPFATLPIVYERQKRFFQLSASFNLLAFLAIAALLSQGVVTSAFWMVGLLSIVYYLGLNLWLFKVATSEQEG